jgi:hypothetical protein
LGERLQVLIMNFMDLIKKSFSDSWTGGASIDPSTGLQGAPNRFHGPGAFDNFKMADLFDKDRWVREKMGDPNPKSDRQQYTSYYSPRDITETVKEDSNGRTKTIVSKYKDVGDSYSRPMGNYENHPTRYPIGQDAYAEEGPGQGSFAPWSDRQGRRPLLPSPYPMRGVNAEEGPGMGSFAPWSDRAGQRQPMQHSPFRAQSRGVYHDEMPGSTPPRQSNTTYEPNPGDDSNWRAFPGKFSMPPGYPGQQNLPSISPATRQIGTPMLPRGSWDRRARAQEQAIASGQRPYSYNMPQAEPFRSTPTQSGWNPGNLFDQARGDVNTEGKLLARMLDPAYGDTIPVDVKRKMIELMLQRSD